MATARVLTTAQRKLLSRCLEHPYVCISMLPHEVRALRVLKRRGLVDGGALGWWRTAKGTEALTRLEVSDGG